MKPVVTEKYWIENGDESKNLAHLDSSDNPNAEARIKTIQFFTEKYCKNRKLSIETLLGKNLYL